MAEKKGWRERISHWWHGEFKVWDDPGVIGYHTERHWTSDLAHKIVDFYLAHWQWVWGTLIAVVAIWATLIAG
jgi:hypothetical protein